MWGEATPSFPTGPGEAVCLYLEALRRVPSKNGPWCPAHPHVTCIMENLLTMTVSLPWHTELWVSLKVGWPTLNPSCTWNILEHCGCNHFIVWRNTSSGMPSLQPEVTKQMSNWGSRTLGSRFHQHNQTTKGCPSASSFCDHMFIDADQESTFWPFCLGTGAEFQRRN